MRWATYVSPVGGSDRVGLWQDGSLYGLGEPVRLVDLLAGDRLAEAAERARADPFEVVAADAVRLRAPVPVPPSIRDFMAFEEHVATAMRRLGRKVDPDWYEIPVFYFSNPAAVRGPHDDIPVAPGSSRFDFELEIGAVVGRAGSDLRPEDAEDHIAGYLVFCDWSARDLQAREMRQSLGPAKGKDTATSLGPYLVTPDELADARDRNAYNLEMTASVNGVQYTRGNFADLYWSYGQLLAYASRGTTLVPGDVIGSGTVGSGCIYELSLTHGSERYPWLVPGDVVRLEVDRLGAIESRITPGADPVPLRES